MIKAKSSVKWIDIKLKLKMEWKTNGRKKEQRDNVIIPFTRSKRK